MLLEKPLKLIAAAAWEARCKNSNYVLDVVVKGDGVVASAGVVAESDGWRSGAASGESRLNRWLRCELAGDDGAVAVPGRVWLAAVEASAAQLRLFGTGTLAPVLQG